jgi:phenylpropionate dioxygenase-like ring-hydroxylating dioxygenase large terminal subunit
MPNGWYCVVVGDELARGAVLPVTALGKELVAWRGHDGVAHVADAFCPHLGAHLGHGGVVVDDTLRCPFHGWRFGGDGACVDAPYATKTPRCGLGSWTTVEKNGGVFVWYHAAGDDPDVELPSLPEPASPQWTRPVRKSWQVRSHPQEMGENSVDSAHFLFVHGTLEVPTLELDTSDERVFHVVNHARNRRFGRVVETSVDIRVHGPGFSAIRFTEFAEVLLIAFTTPIDDEHVVQRFCFQAKKAGNPLVRAAVSTLFIREVARQFEQDMPIWEHKQHLPRPVLCDGDGPIWAFRRWYQRFYSPPVVGGALRVVNDG